MSFFGDALGGFGNGLLALGGLGSLSDPLGDLKGELSSATQEQQQLINRSTLDASELNLETLQEMYNLQNVAQTRLQGTIELNDLILWQGLKQDKLFLAMVAAVVLLVIIYLLFYPICC